MANATAHYFPVFEPATRANPHIVYEQMRQQSPIYHTIGQLTGNPVWIFTEYEDVQWALKEPRFVKDARRNLPPDLARRYASDEDDVYEAINYHLLNVDPPDHTRLRALVHKAFTPRTIADLQPRIHSIAQSLLDDMARRQEGDLIDAFAYPLPITVIGEMLGVGTDNQAKFREWTRYLLISGTNEQAQLAVMEFVQFINELIDERQKRPTNDILSNLVHAEEAGDTLNRLELLSMVFLLLVAGHETTVNLIGNGTLALLQHPQQMQKLRANPQLIASAVEEMLRYNGPVETPTLRFASQDVAYKGHTMRAGDIILPSLLAANRDPKVFRDPNTFDITRDPNPHVAFGYGIHYCLGAPLARMEGSIAINALVQRFPGLRLTVPADALAWNDSILLHGMKALPVAWA
jgi:cytochrome P450 PksS